MSKIYGFPILPKSGLANMLVPWAECYIWCCTQGIEQIAPYWRKIRIGPYLRGERDKRQYHRLFLTGGNISGLKRLFLQITAKKITLEEFNGLKNIKHNSRPIFVCFSDMNHLSRLKGNHKEIINELYRITKPKYWPVGLPQSFIGVHIRMGDFPQKSDGNKQIYFVQPLDWYIMALYQLRNSLGINLPAIIFSDGSERELEPLLKLDNVFRSPFSRSISDLLAIAKSKAIITSRSSFSLLGAFLGQVPSIWYIGKSDICGNGYMNGPHDSKFEIEWMPDQKFPDKFIDELKNRITLG